MRNLPIIIIILPLSAALLSLALSKIHYHLGRNVIICAIAGSLVCSVVQLKNIVENGPVRYAFGGYRMPYGIEFSIDSLSALILVMIFTMSLITCIYSGRFEGTKDPVKIGGAYTMLALLTVGMAGMTSTGDVFNMYVFLEITSLSGYCLIALGGSRGIVSAFRYLLIGTVAATAYLLGIGILYGTTGTLNMADLGKILNEPGHEDAMLMSMCFFIGAFGIKMAMFPFHGWQPSAYTHAEAGARPLITGVMGKIPAYALFRFLYCIYGTDYKYFRYFLVVLGVLSCIGMIYGSVRAMAQTDVRKVFAYSSIAQISYISLGIAIGSPMALVGAFLHMLGHAFMKGGLFFCAGAIRYRFGTVKLDDFGRIYKKMPLTCGLITLASLSMVGIPPAVGFFSKWYLALGAAGTQHYIYIAILVLSSLLNAVYFFKLIEKVFINRARPELVDGYAGRKLELPVSMLIAIVVCFVAILFLGLFNARIADIILMTVKEVAL
jgi:multicomponent Na+:H+ antiporter subunit D